jgi:hypothetical protein
VVSPYPRFFADTAVLARALAARVTTWIAARPAAVAAARERLRDDPPWAEYVLEALVDAELVPRAVAERERGEINPRELPTAVRAALAVPPQQADSRVRATLVIAAAAGDRVDPLARMRAIARLADRCAGLAARSWDAAPLTAEDTEFLRGFGEELAFVCGYLSFPRPPPDDVPVVVTVAQTVGLGGGDRALQVGVGRPEWLWALVPVGDRLVVHQGAVLTYREQAVALRHGEFDDAAWRAAARRRALPEPPAFTRGFRVVR